MAPAHNPPAPQSANETPAVFPLDYAQRERKSKMADEGEEMWNITFTCFLNVDFIRVLFLLWNQDEDEIYHSRSMCDNYRVKRKVRLLATKNVCVNFLDDFCKTLWILYRSLTNMKLSFFMAAFLAWEWPMYMTSTTRPIWSDLESKRCWFSWLQWNNTTLQS